MTPARLYLPADKELQGSVVIGSGLLQVQHEEQVRPLVVVLLHVTLKALVVRTHTHSAPL